VETLREELGRMKLPVNASGKEVVEASAKAISQSLRKKQGEREG